MRFIREKTRVLRFKRSNHWTVNCRRMLKRWSWNGRLSIGRSYWQIGIGFKLIRNRRGLLPSNRKPIMARLPDCAAVKSLEVLEGYRVRLCFRDGCVKIVDLEEVLLPREGLAKDILDDPNYFRTVHLDRGTVCWDNGLDICSDLLRYDLKTTWLEEHPEVKTTRKSYVALPGIDLSSKTPAPKSTRRSAKPPLSTATNKKKLSSNKVASESARGRRAVTKKSSPRA